MMKQMMVKTFASIAVLTMAAYSQVMPFPQAKTYEKGYAGCIKPNLDQALMNQHIKTAYDEYKTLLRESGSTPGGYYIFSKDTKDGWNVVTVSEAHGWGMVIMTQMAGYDPDAKKYFDGMVKFYEAHKASGNGVNLMTWRVESNGSGGETFRQSSSALDGDMDIAYALLLAYKQWGEEQYKTKAINILNDIYKHQINPDTKGLQLGNWVPDNLSQASNTYSYPSVAKSRYYHTRPSDWMAGHLRTFADATGDTKWDAVADNIYSIYEKFQSQSYATSGLISDFVYYEGGADAHSVEANFLEGPYDGAYATNASRVPWRMAGDFAHYQKPETKAALKKISDFIIRASEGFPSKIYPGYWLDGTPLKTNYTDPAFTAPLVASAIVSTDQRFLTNGWNYLQDSYMKGSDAFQKAIRLQSMLLISGNWWNYNDAPEPDPDGFDTTGVYLDTFGDTDPQTDLEARVGKAKYPSKPWEGGYGWMLEDWLKGKVLTSTGAEWKKSTWDADGNEIVGNMAEVFKGGKMSIQMQDSSALWTNLPNIDGKADNTDFHDLSTMTGFTIKAKGDGPLKIIFKTDDTGTLEKDKFWGYYTTEINLTSEMKEYQIVAGLLAPVSFSQEQANAWNWKDNGSKNVTGVSLAYTGGKEKVAVEIESFKLNGVKDELFGLKPVDNNFDKTGMMLDDFSDSYGDGPTQSHLAAVYGYSKHGDLAKGAGYWYSYGYGGAKVMNLSGTEIGEKNTADLIDNGVMKGKFDVSAGEGDFGAAVECPLPEGNYWDLSSLKGIVIKAKGTGKVRIGLVTEAEDDKWWDGYGYDVELTETVTEISIKAENLEPTLYSEEANKNYTWAANGSKKVKALKIATISGGAAEFEIESIKLSGIQPTDFGFTQKPYEGTAITDGSVLAKSGISRIHSTAGIVKADLTLPQAGSMSIAVVNTQGRVVAKQNLAVQSGLNNISIDMSGRAAGVYYMVAKGANISLQQKFMLR